MHSEIWPADLVGTSTSWGLQRLFLDGLIAFGIKLVQWSLELTSE